ncbi:polyprenyl synthetase family protein [Kocuria rhizophila]|nr:polyprenyl synthetase family protein [Kocuria rhizophila]
MSLARARGAPGRSGPATSSADVTARHLLTPAASTSGPCSRCSRRKWPGPSVRGRESRPRWWWSSDPPGLPLPRRRHRLRPCAGRGNHAVWGSTVAIAAGHDLRAGLVHGVRARPRSSMIQARTFEAAGHRRAAKTAGPAEGTTRTLPGRHRGQDRLLIAASGQYGALLGGAPPSVVDLMVVYGEQAGLALQLADDIIDLTGHPDVSGKTRGTDLREGVDTLPVPPPRREAAEPTRRRRPRHARCSALVDGDLSDTRCLRRELAASEHPVSAEAWRIANQWADEAIEVLAPPDDSVASRTPAVAHAVVHRTGWSCQILGHRRSACAPRDPGGRADGRTPRGSHMTTDTRQGGAAKEAFSGRTMLILAAIGSAVGLGNICASARRLRRERRRRLDHPLPGGTCSPRAFPAHAGLRDRHRTPRFRPASFRRLHPKLETIGGGSLGLRGHRADHARTTRWAMQYTVFSFTKAWTDRLLFMSDYMQVSDEVTIGFDYLAGAPG